MQLESWLRMTLIATLSRKTVGIVSSHLHSIVLSNEHVLPVLQEAIANGNPSLVKLIMKYRNYQRNVQRIRGIPDLLRKLKEVSLSMAFFRSPCQRVSFYF